MTSEVTRLLKELKAGKRETLDKLLPLVYDELHKIAHRHLRKEYSSPTLQTTALVHEAYLKLVDQHSVDWENKGQFFGIASQSMRRILVDYARERNAKKRDGIKISLDDVEVRATEANENILDLDIALKELAEFDELQAKIVELRYFAGLTFEEVAAVLQISPSNVFREWTIAKAWLYKKING